VGLDPTIGREIKKTRPCLIVSPDEMNQALGTVLAAPMTTGGFKAPTRVPVTFQGKQGFVVLDQLRALDKSRLIKKAGQVSPGTGAQVLAVLQEMFNP
jgi:mRNA interferase MazF